MRPAPRSKEELLRWVMGLVAREQAAGTYGSIVINIENGTIIQARTERNERPPVKSREDDEREKRLLALGIQPMQPTHA